MTRPENMELSLQQIRQRATAWSRNGIRFACNKTWQAITPGLLLQRIQTKSFLCPVLQRRCSIKLKDEYVVGLWRSNLVHELFWRHSGSGGENYRPGPGRIAPSWFWMSVSGSAGVYINTTSCSSAATDCKHHIKIVYATVDKVDPTRPTGDIFPGSGILQLQGQLKPASWLPMPQYSFHDWRKYQITFDGEVGAAFQDFRNNQTLTHPGLMDRLFFDREIFLLPVKTSSKRGKTESLLLTPVRKGACLYERIGHHDLDGINPLLFKERSKGKGERLGNTGWKDIAVTDIIII